MTVKLYLVLVLALVACAIRPQVESVNPSPEDENEIPPPLSEVVSRIGEEQPPPVPQFFIDETIANVAAIQIMTRHLGFVSQDDIRNITRLNFSLDQLLTLFGPWLEDPVLMGSDFTTTSCDVAVQCVNGFDTYETLLECLTTMIKNCPFEVATIETLSTEKEKYKCPEHFVDLSGFDHEKDEFATEVFKHRREYMRVTFKQKKYFVAKCLENGGRFSVKKIHLVCEQLKVFPCEMFDKSSTTQVEKDELVRICEEKKINIVDIRDGHLTAHLEDLVLNHNASGVCLVLDKQQLSELEEFAKVARIEAYIHVSTKTTGDFRGQISTPEYAGVNSDAYAVFYAGQFKGSAGMVRLPGKLGKRVVGLTARHVVKDLTNVWMCNSIECLCTSVIIPAKGSKSDIAFLYSPELEKRQPSAILSPVSKNTILDLLAGDGFLQFGGKINPMSFNTRYAKASVNVGDYKYLLVDYHTSMQSGMSGSLVRDDNHKIIGVFGGSWSKYFWESTAKGMVGFVTEEDLSYYQEYKVERVPSCIGSGSIVGEHYREAVADSVEGVVNVGLQYLRGN